MPPFIFLYLFILFLCFFLIIFYQVSTFGCTNYTQALVGNAMVGKSKVLGWAKSRAHTWWSMLHRILFLLFSQASLLPLFLPSLLPLPFPPLPLPLPFPSPSLKLSLLSPCFPYFPWILMRYLTTWNPEWRDLLGWRVHTKQPADSRMVEYYKWWRHRYVTDDVHLRDDAESSIYRLDG